MGGQMIALRTYPANHAENPVFSARSEIRKTERKQLVFSARSDNTTRVVKQKGTETTSVFLSTEKRNGKPYYYVVKCVRSAHAHTHFTYRSTPFPPFRLNREI